ncbi:MAG TPA: hypothetical protein VGP47_01910 [Parachlamydiaceae bacterium]|nr:hypothetical protein [Parachlamydiaceae bacterium]
MPNQISNFSPFDPSKTLEKASYEETPQSNGSACTSIKAITIASVPSFMARILPIVEKVKKVAQFILTVGISALLYWMNPSLFAIGFISGIIFDDQVRVAIQKIKDVWNNQKLVGTLFGSFACALSMPVTLATASLLWSAHFGSLMPLDLPQSRIDSNLISSEP